MSVPESFLDRGDALVLHQPLNKGCVAFVSLTLNPFRLSCNSAFGKATLDVVGVSGAQDDDCLLYTSPSPRDATLSRMPSSA